MSLLKSECSIVPGCFEPGAAASQSSVASHSSGAWCVRICGHGPHANAGSGNLQEAPSSHRLVLLCVPNSDEPPISLSWGGIALPLQRQRIPSMGLWRSSPQRTGHRRVVLNGQKTKQQFSGILPWLLASSRQSYAAKRGRAEQAQGSIGNW